MINGPVCNGDTYIGCTAREVVTSGAQRGACVVGSYFSKEHNTQGIIFFTTVSEMTTESRERFDVFFEFHEGCNARGRGVIVLPLLENVEEIRIGTFLVVAFHVLEGYIVPLRRHAAIGNYIGFWGDRSCRVRLRQ